MFDRPVKSIMDDRKLLVAPPECSVSEATRRMADRNVGAVLVVQDESLVGIFTERDAVFRVMARGLDANTTPLSEVMTPEPKTVSPEKPFGYALVMMQENGFRHAPIVENGRPVGIVSSRSAMDPELEEFESEASRRRQFS